ncbi:MAG: hypothetical protein GWN58_28180, partial [Anaerolineae bacterium]|nr:hypothetical protein [Anaerolineae bacterium]
LSGNIDDLIIEADPGRLTQILNNLISNACKFSPKGSEVAISALRDGNHVRIYVVDQGPGIP